MNNVYLILQKFSEGKGIFFVVSLVREFEKKIAILNGPRFPYYVTETITYDTDHTF